MEYSDLLTAYHQLLAVSRDQFLEEESSNFVLTLYETESLRILMVRTGEDDHPVRIETEVTFPLRIPNLNAIQDILTDPVQNTVLKPLLGEMRAHLEYLRTLSDAGFKLEILGEECVWIASCTLKNPPSKELYSLLKPPKRKDYKS